MRAEQVKGLMEAYSKIHETPELLSEGVVEEETQQLNEYGAGGTGGTAQDLINKRQATLKKVGGTLGAGGGQAAMAALQKKGVDSRSAYAQVYRQGEKNLAAKPAPAAPKPAAKPGTPVAAKPTTPAAPARPASPAKPAAAPAAAKPAAATPKPTTPAAPAKPAGSAMDQWAKANPKLAAAKAERDRTRGTSATTNPLMKDMKANLPAPKSPSPSTAKTGFDLAKKGVNLAAGVDIFDLVKGHLLDEGYADSEEGAMVIMVNMSEEWRKSILEAHGVELDENREHDREMRKAAARERAEEKRDRKEEGKKSAKSPGREGPSAGKSYADYQEISIKSHDKKTKGKHTVGNPFPEHVEYVDEAQEAREKPEEHEEKEEKENEKKYGHVRGEKTPMPPRGNKRREEFEKWYAKNVR